MTDSEAAEQLKLIRENIERPISEFTRTGLSITALTYGIDALEESAKLKKEAKKIADEWSEQNEVN